MEFFIIFIIVVIGLAVLTVRVRLGIEKLGHRNDARLAVRYQERFGFRQVGTKPKFGFGDNTFDGRLPIPPRPVVPPAARNPRRTKPWTRADDKAHTIQMARDKELDSPYAHHLRHADHKARKTGAWHLLRVLGGADPKKAGRAGKWSRRVDALFSLVEADREMHHKTRTHPKHGPRMDKKTGRNLPGIRRSDRPHVHLVPANRNPDTRKKPEKKSGKRDSKPDKPNRNGGKKS